MSEAGRSRTPDDPTNLHVERIADEVVLTVTTDDDPDGGILVSLSIPDGVQEFIAALRAEAEL